MQRLKVSVFRARLLRGGGVAGGGEEMKRAKRGDNNVWTWQQLQVALAESACVTECPRRPSVTIIGTLLEPKTDKKVSRAERLLLVRHQAQLDLLIHALSCLLLLLVPVEIVWYIINRSYYTQQWGCVGLFEWSLLVSLNRIIKPMITEYKTVIKLQYTTL